ncbi:Rop family plasmid primer RNA-binding protein, partial [Klebsiella pneumoniae]
MTKQQKTALNMAKYLQSPSLFSCPAIP